MASYCGTLTTIPPDRLVHAVSYVLSQSHTAVTDEEFSDVYDTRCWFKFLRIIHIDSLYSNSVEKNIKNTENKVQIFNEFDIEL